VKLLFGVVWFQLRAFSFLCDLQILLGFSLWVVFADFFEPWLIFLGRSGTFLGNRPDPIWIFENCFNLV
jgi:hypothetical protein